MTDCQERELKATVRFNEDHFCGLMRLDLKEQARDWLGSQSEMGNNRGGRFPACASSKDRQTQVGLRGSRCGEERGLTSMALLSPCAYPKVMTMPPTHPHRRLLGHSASASLSGTFLPDPTPLYCTVRCTLPLTKSFLRNSTS